MHTQRGRRAWSAHREPRGPPWSPAVSEDSAAERGRLAPAGSRPKDLASVGAQHAAPLRAQDARLPALEKSTDAPSSRCPAEAGHRLTGSYSGGIEAQLQELQPVVVVLPEEVLETRVEEIHPHGSAGRHSKTRRQRGEKRDVEVERDRRERRGHVAEAALPLHADEDLVLRRADGPGVGAGKRAAGGIGAGLYRRLAARFREGARPDGVRARAIRRQLE